MHELTNELLETLANTTNYIKEYTKANDVKLPNQQKFNSLITKTETLLNEISSTKSPFLIYKKPIRRKVYC